MLQEFYWKSISAALDQFTDDLVLKTVFEDVLRESFISDYTMIVRGSVSAIESHRERLAALRPSLRGLKTNRICFCCLMEMPEKVLRCGHAYCDTCVRAFGGRSKSHRHSYCLSDCMICGERDEHSFQLVPPTAGIRILSLDGGGVRGIVPLTFLCHIEETLSWLDCSLRDHFDLACGTSSGMLLQQLLKTEG